ncbi:MAG TPA: chromate transporter [Terriglobales bacterium]|nr:chromate transporter [Terriglobales bacterium]
MPKISLFKLFTATFTLSAFTIGGGYVIVPLMRKRFVEEYGWIDENEMLDLVAIAQSGPGPIAVNASILVGYRVAGLVGALVATLGTALPPLIILSVISMFYTAFAASGLVASALAAMRVGVAAVIADVVIQMDSDVLKKKDFVLTAIMCAAFVANWWLGVNVVLIILVSGAAGVLLTKLRENKASREKKEDDEHAV